MRVRRGKCALAALAFVCLSDLLLLLLLLLLLYELLFMQEKTVVGVQWAAPADALPDEVGAFEWQTVLGKQVFKRHF